MLYSFDLFMNRFKSIYVVKSTVLTDVLITIFYNIDILAD